MEPLEISVERGEVRERVSVGGESQVKVERGGGNGGLGERGKFLFATELP